MELILVAIVILLVLGLLPAWPYSANWGYGPSGLLGIVLILLLVMLLTGRL